MIGNYFFSNSGAAAYEIEQSLRFNRDDSTQLTRTFGTCTASGGPWTTSMWVKLGFGDDSNIYALWGADYGTSTSGDNYGTLNSNRHWANYVERSNGAWGMSEETLGKARDPGAWYHYLLSFNNPNGATLWINGVQQSVTYSNGGSSSGGNFGSEASQWNRNGVTGSIGSAYTTNGYSNFHWSGYIAEVHHLDGTAVSDPYDFGEFDDNGVWRPIEVSGVTYGNQGFYLKFDPSATNGIGHDHSGNGNNWTASGFYTSEGTGNYIASDEMNASWQNLPYGSMDGTTTTAGYSGTSSVTYTPPSAVSYNTLEVKFGNGNNVTSKQGSELKINGTTVARVPTGTGGVGTAIYSTSTAGSFTSISSGPPNPGEYGCTIYYIKVNGSMLIDNTASAIYNDVKEDAPTNNWCTLNPLDQRLTDNGTISDGNLTYVQSSTGGRTGRGTIGVSSGKWYWEFIPLNTGNMNVGVTLSTSDLGVYVGDDSLGWSYVASGHKSFNTETTYGSSYTWGDVIGVALDMDAGTITFYKNGVSQGQAFSGITGTVFPSAGTSNVSNCSFSLNFGQRPFTYTPPTGFNSVCTANLAAPDIADGSQYFNVVTYTGDGQSSKAITGVGFQPNLSVIKNRSNSNHHVWQDSVRGITANNGNQLVSSQTFSENDNGNGHVGSYDSDGFTVEDGTSANYPRQSTNDNNNNYVAWLWKAGTASGSSNTAGSVTSTVSANPSAGFSIITWNTSSSSAYTVGHGLGVAPKVLIVKKRDGNTNWFVRHGAVHTGNGALFLNSTGSGDSGSTVFNGTNPSSTVITLNGASTDLRGSQICYAFAEVEGYSKLGMYASNNSSNGPFVYTGFKPSLVVVKSVSGHGGWMVYDTARMEFNPGGDNSTAYPMSWDRTLAESSFWNAYQFDILSNGFKLRSSQGDVNYSGNYVYLALAENPFGGSGVSPATAR